MTTFSRRGGARNGFTLLELLVVIVIIVVLIGLLFPVIHKVKLAGYNADTQSEITQLSNAISQYHTDFGAYPGPFSNDQIEGITAGITMEQYVPGGAPPYTAYAGTPWNTTNATGFTSSANVSGAENLVLGLLGGLRIDSTNNNPAFAPTEVGMGPMSLNLAGNFKRSTAYLQTTGGSSSLLLWCGSGPLRSPQYQSAMTLTQFEDETGATSGDSPIPEFVDRYPTPGPLPILYLRARVGASGVISTFGAVTPFQYDLRDIYEYTNSHIGLDPRKYPTHNLTNLGTANGTLTTQSPTTANAMQYFWNRTIPPTNAALPNDTGQPRAVDAYILISAGPDGIYGTADDITSFGQVAP